LKLPPIAKTTNVPTKITNAAPTYQTFAASLAQKSQPTLLYQAPSHTGFTLASYGAALFFFSYAGISFYHNTLFPPPDLAAWVPVAFGGVCFMMACFGGWLILGPARLIKTIIAIPQKAAQATGANLAKVAAQPELKLEVELRKMFPLPFFPARKLYVKPEEIVLPATLMPFVERLSPAQMMAMRTQEEEERKKAIEYERSHIMTAPFRHASRAFYHAFVAMRRTWSREGFLKIIINGQAYKLDLVGGWALDRGRALDRLVTIKPSL